MERIWAEWWAGAFLWAHLKGRFYSTSAVMCYWKDTHILTHVENSFLFSPPSLMLLGAKESFGVELPSSMFFHWNKRIPSILHFFPKFFFVCVPRKTYSYTFKHAISNQNFENFSEFSSPKPFGGLVVVFVAGLFIWPWKPTVTCRALCCLKLARPLNAHLIGSLSWFQGKMDVKYHSHFLMDLLYCCVKSRFVFPVRQFVKMF